MQTLVCNLTFGGLATLRFERKYTCRGKRLIELRDRLHDFRVLDPACGSGNFLYIAYRELKRLEAHLLERVHGNAPELEQVLKGYDQPAQLLAPLALRVPESICLFHEPNPGEP